MRSARLASLCALFALFLSASASAQEARFGIGIRLNEIIGSTQYIVFDEFGGSQTFGGNGLGATVLFPIDLPSVRIEPEFAFVGSGRSLSSGDRELSNSQHAFAIGAGIFGRSAASESVTALFGARIRYLRTVTEQQDFGDDDPDEDTTNGFAIGPVVGAEYAIGDHFALGGELGLFYQRTSPGDLPADTSLSESATTTQASVFLRFFF